MKAWKGEGLTERSSMFPLEILERDPPKVPLQSVCILLRFIDRNCSEKAVVKVPRVGFLLEVAC